MYYLKLQNIMRETRVTGGVFALNCICFISLFAVEQYGIVHFLYFSGSKKKLTVDRWSCNPAGDKSSGDLLKSR